ncbi:MAG: hypothetical protein OEX02_06490 [Cyclobacteriaceae bacterium]|nr:hypothetical protein [Cyclobacteriaceae bacterium]
MKTKSKITGLLASIFSIFAIMTTAVAQEYDDMYFRSKDRKVNKKETPVSAKQEVTLDTLDQDEVPDKYANPDYLDRVESYNSEESGDEGYFDEDYDLEEADGKNVTINNYYGRSSWDDIYWSNPWFYRNTVYDPFYRVRVYSPYRHYRRYTHYHNPYYYGSGFYITSGWGWSSVSYGWASHYEPYYYDPYYYDPWGYSSYTHRHHHYYGGGYYYPTTTRVVYANSSYQNYDGRTIRRGQRSSRSSISGRYAYNSAGTSSGSTGVVGRKSTSTGGRYASSNQPIQTRRTQSIASSETGRTGATSGRYVAEPESRTVPTRAGYTRSTGRTSNFAPDRTYESRNLTTYKTRSENKTLHSSEGSRNSGVSRDSYQRNSNSTPNTTINRNPAQNSTRTRESYQRNNSSSNGRTDIKPSPDRNSNGTAPNNSNYGRTQSKSYHKSYAPNRTNTAPQMNRSGSSGNSNSRYTPSQSSGSRSYTPARSSGSSGSRSYTPSSSSGGSNGSSSGGSMRSTPSSSSSGGSAPRSSSRRGN